MIEIADNKPQSVLDCHAVVYRHLINLYEHFWIDVFGKLDGVMRTLIFCESFNEMIAMAQNNYIDDYYKRIKRKAV